MSQRWWYLRRGVAWTALSGSAAAAAVVAGALEWWPAAAAVLLPALLGCCAAAAAFTFDEQATAVVAVTPRGAGWRRTARLTVVTLPLAGWSLVVLLRPGDLPLDRLDWWVLGGATIALTAGLAAWASRRDVAAPGSTLASLVAFAVLTPVVVTAFLGWDSVYPVDGLARGAWTFWSVVAGGAAIAWLAALRPGLRR